MDVIAAMSAFGAAPQIGLRFSAAEAASWFDEVPTDAGDADRRAIEALLSPTPVAIDALVRLSGLASSVAAKVLLDLELAGQLVCHAGGRAAA